MLHKRINYLFCLSVHFNVHCKKNITHQNNSHIKKKIEENKKDYHYYIKKTIEKINLYKKYQIKGHLLPQHGKIYSKFKINYENNNPSLSDLDKIINDFYNYQEAKKNKGYKPEYVVINIDLNEKVKFESSAINLLAERGNPKIKAKVKLGHISVTSKPKLEEYPVISKMISEDYFDLTNIKYILHENKNVTALLFYHTSGSKKHINNFIIMLFGNKQHKKYHIFNITGIILCIENRLFMIDVDTINKD